MITACLGVYLEIGFILALPFLRPRADGTFKVEWVLMFLAFIPIWPTMIAFWMARDLMTASPKNRK